MKIVKKLNKKKHRYDLWVDNDNGLWYFDEISWEWRILIQADPADRCYGDYLSVETKGWPDGPYRRVVKGQRP